MANQRIADFIQGAPTILGAAVAADDAIPIYDRSADATKSLTPAELSAALGGGESPIIESDWVTLTDAEIKALPTTAIQILPAPGAGKMIELHFGVGILDSTAGGYTTDSGPSLVLGLGATLAALEAVSAFVPFLASPVLCRIPFPATPLLAGIGDFAGLIVPRNPSGALTSFENLPLMIGDSWTGVSNYTGGNAANTLKVKVWYTEVAFS